MIKNLGVQLYTVRDYLNDPEFADLTFKKLRELGYTEVQTAGTAFDEFEFGKLLAKHGLSVVGTHCSLDEIVGQQEKMLELHRAWGTTNIGIGGMPTARRKDLATLKEFIAEFNRAAEFYGKHGLKLTYHHHNFEFLRMDGKKTIMDLFCEEFDPDNISFVLDTCWISAGGGEVVEWMERLAGRLDTLLSELPSSVLPLLSSLSVPSSVLPSSMISSSLPLSGLSVASIKPSSTSNDLI